MDKYLPYIIGIALIAGSGYAYIMNNTNKGSEAGNAGNNSSSQIQNGYEVDMVSDMVNIKPNEPSNFIYKIKNEKGEVLKDFIIAHEKIMHLIVVRDDLQYFQHLHPKYNTQTGEFSIKITYPTDGPYTMFPDFTPGHTTGNHNLTPVSAKFSAKIGDQGRYSKQFLNPDKQNEKIMNGYQIGYSFSEPQKSKTPFSYKLNISQNGKPVNKLEKYLGALGHSVILKEGTLDYIHTHAGDKEAASSHAEHGQKDVATNVQPTGPDIKFATLFPAKGNYKIFTQFQHMGKVMTTDYVVAIE